MKASKKRIGKTGTDGDKKRGREENFFWTCAHRCAGEGVQRGKGLTSEKRILKKRGIESMETVQIARSEVTAREQMSKMLWPRGKARGLNTRAEGGVNENAER